MPLKLAFMGTPDFAIPTLSELLDAGHDVVQVLSQPPRRAGRGHGLKRSPVHEFSDAHGLLVRTPATLKQESEIAAFRALDLDAAVVVAYGLLLPPPILEAPRLGCFNLHASLLPRWRGAAPIERAILAGDEETGVMVMHMDAGLDTGPVLLAERTAIGAQTTAGELRDRLAQIGASLMVRALAALERGGLTATPQRGDGASYAPKITKADARIDWRRPAEVVARQIRAFHPSPGAWFELEADGHAIRVKVLRAQIVAGSGTPGSLIDPPMTVACGEGALRLLEVQRAGKAPCPGDAFLRGIPAGLAVALV